MFIIYFIICCFTFWAIFSRTYKDGIVGKICYGVCFIGSALCLSDLYNSTPNISFGLTLLLIAIALLCIRSFMRIIFKEYHKIINIKD